MNFSPIWAAALPVWCRQIRFDDQAELAPIPSRQREFRAGRLCAAEALAGAGLAAPIEIGRDQDGLPIWPPGWLGSISHCRLGAIAMVAATKHCQALGVDMEPWLDQLAAQQIAPHIATPAEIEVVAPIGIERGLTLIYSAKESLYKALFPEIRCFYDFSAAELLSIGDETLTLALTTDWSRRWRRGARFELVCRAAADYLVTALIVAAGDEYGFL